MEEQHPWTSQQSKEKEKDTKERASTKVKAQVKGRATEDTKDKAKDLFLFIEPCLNQPGRKAPQVE